MLGAASLSPVAHNTAPGVAAVAPGIAAPFSPPWAPSALAAATGGVLGAAPDLLAPVVVEYISPSAIETATEELGGCLRKWAWAKLDRVPKTSGKAAELGSAMHAQHERYLEHGTPYDLTTRAGELAIATLHLLPAPGVAIVEQEFRVQVAGLGWLGGKVDANWAEDPHAAAPWTHAEMAGTLPRRGGLGRRQIILDHKSTGDIRWAKLTREELLHHPQAPIYASFWWSAGRREVRVKNSKEWRAWDPGFVPNEIELRWNYVTTKGKPKAEPSWHVVEPDEVWAAFAAYVAPGAKRLLEVVQEANETRASGKPFGAMQLPANPSACGAFGGCQFRDRCGVSPLEGVRAMAEQSLAFLTKMGLAAAPAGQPIGLPSAVVEQPASATAPVAAAPAPIASSPIPAVAQASAAPWMPPAAAQAAPVAAPAPAPAPFVAPAAASSAPTQGAPAVQGYGSQINPPESALPVAAPVAPAVEAAPAPSEPAPAAEPAAPKKGPGRPKKEKGVVASAAAPTEADQEVEETLSLEAAKAYFSQGSLHDRALIAVLPAAFEACKAAIFAGTAAPASALELARAVVAPLKEEAAK